MYRVDLKFLDIQIWVNRVDPDQTAGAVWSGSLLFAILSASFECIYITSNIVYMVNQPYSNLRLITTIYQVSELLEFLR